MQRVSVLCAAVDGFAVRVCVTLRKTKLEVHIHNRALYMYYSVPVV
jgi:hypothetical protein